jgi:hypothetical protein
MRKSDCGLSRYRILDFGYRIADFARRPLVGSDYLLFATQLVTRNPQLVSAPNTILRRMVLSHPELFLPLRLPGQRCKNHF